jgi:hypothetical protein
MSHPIFRVFSGDGASLVVKKNSDKNISPNKAKNAAFGKELDLYNLYGNHIANLK